MKVVIVDDHFLVRDALGSVVHELKPEAEIFEAASARQAFEILREHPSTQLLLVDLALPDRSGFEVLSEVAVRHPTVSTVVLSAFSDRANVMKALELGALGFIPKSASRDVMLSAFRLILAGSLYLPPDLVGRGIPTSAVMPSVETVDAEPDNASSSHDLGLTERQVEVLTLLMQGMSNKAIGRFLNVAEPTVKNHVTAVFKALAVTTRVEAVLKVAELGLKLPPPQEK